MGAMLWITVTFSRMYEGFQAMEVVSFNFRSSINYVLCRTAYRAFTFGQYRYFGI
jgi:hypothetical protein